MPCFIKPTFPKKKRTEDFFARKRYQNYFKIHNQNANGKLQMLENHYFQNKSSTDSKENPNLSTFLRKLTLTKSIYQSRTFVAEQFLAFENQTIYMLDAKHTVYHFSKMTCLSISVCRRMNSLTAIYALFKSIYIGILTILDI